MLWRVLRRGFKRVNTSRWGRPRALGCAALLDWLAYRLNG